MSIALDKPTFEDKTLICADCGQEFIYTVGEQIFFSDKGLAEPKRCKPCRMLRKRSIVNIVREGNYEHNGTS